MGDNKERKDSGDTKENATARHRENHAREHDSLLADIFIRKSENTIRRAAVYDIYARDEVSGKTLSLCQK